MDVRDATLDDVPAIAEMQDMHWEEKSDKVNALPYDPQFSRKNLIEFFDKKDHLFLVAVTEGTVVGYIWCSLVQPHYSQAWYAVERYLYVKPQYRRGRATKYLLEAAINYSRHAGAHHLQLGDMSGNTRLERAYEKRFTKIGTVYQIDL